MNERCVYTAITGGFDQPKPVLKPNPSYDYILFTDDKSITSVKGWTKIIYLEEDDTPPRLKAKRPKILPHKYLPPQYKSSVWVDGSYEIVGDINILFAPYSRSNIVATIHPSGRRSIFEEAEEIMKYGLDTWENMTPQLARYKQTEGFNGNFHNHIYQCGILIRQHDEVTNNIMEQWMSEIENGSIRDQLSFPYILHKNKDRFDSDYRFNKLADIQHRMVLKFHPHNKKINSITFLQPWGFNGLIGDRINKEIARVDNPDEWFVLMDQDTCVLIDGFGGLLNDTINRYPDTSIFGAYTNRIGLSWQKLDNVDPDNFDMMYHHGIANDRVKRYYSICTKINHPVAGFFMMFPKRVWEQTKFQSLIIDKDKKVGEHKGVYFDWCFGQEILDKGGIIRLMEGNYLYHHYRVGKDLRDTTHLTRFLPK